MYAGGSAREQAAVLRVEAAALREQAEMKAQQAQNWDAGAAGEARVGRELARLQSDGWVVLHDRLARPEESKANLDHLAVGPGGVVLIDSKNWSAGAWLYDGMLFRADLAGPVPCRSELAHIRRDAETVAARIGHPVTPVLCLSAPRTGKIIRPAQIAGVHVVPLSQLVRFLRSVPASVPPTDAASVARLLGDCFPTACAAPPLTIPTPAAGASTAQGSPPRARRNDRRRPHRRTAARPQNRRALLTLAGVLAFVVVAPHLLAALGPAVQHAVSRALPSPPTIARFPSPCVGVTDAQVARAVGRKVYRFTTSGTDICRWAYSPSPAVYYPADVEIATGWPVRFPSDAAHGVVQHTHETNAEHILIPQFAPVPGSPLPGTATTQPLAVTVNITGPVTRAAAARAVTALAQLTESHMPTGPGATTVSALR